MKASVYLHSLGCSKNQVDSELMAGVLKREKYNIVSEPQEAEVIIVNTCGFISSAKMESIEAILQLASYKEQGKCRLLLAVGCMAEKYADDMAESMPEIDALMGAGHYEDIAQLINEKLQLPESADAALTDNIYLARDFSSLGETAYIKIAEGCDNACSFCLIPQLRGRYLSRPLAEIVEEAAALAKSGVKELVLLAQDTTYYGTDLYGEPRLAQLLTQLADLPFTMIRLLYAYPTGISEQLIEVMAQRENICHYLDMPIQHSVDNILAAMNRPDSKESILAVIAGLRQAMPDIALRTTLMVGFPGESEEDFSALLAFMQEAKFDWVGAFPYYQEEDTLAATMPAQVDEESKQERLDQLMQLAANITEDKLKALIGQEMTVLVTDSAEEIYGEGWLQGRSQYQAPDVDGVIYFPGKSTNIGDIVHVRIVDNEIYDLIGEQI